MVDDNPQWKVKAEECSMITSGGTQSLIIINNSGNG